MSWPVPQGEPPSQKVFLLEQSSSCAKVMDFCFYIFHQTSSLLCDFVILSQNGYGSFPFEAAQTGGRVSGWVVGGRVHGWVATFGTLLVYFWQLLGHHWATFWQPLGHSWVALWQLLGQPTITLH